ncbi:pheromone processing endoprotease [Ascosphaera aggregata]|nr:pheromone processing endoprotease [Ascosphaera aggregata]
MRLSAAATAAAAAAAAATAVNLVNAPTASYASRLAARNHDTYDYFALHIDSSVTRPEEVARWLGATHEGQIGELEDHHTFSSPKERASEIQEKLDDAKLRRWRRRRRRGRRIRSRGESEIEREREKQASIDTADEQDTKDVLDSVLWSQKLTLQPPKVKRLPAPSQPPQELDGRLSTRRKTKNVPELVRRKESIAAALNINDPGFMDQWHLFNTAQPGHDLNVTGLWLEGYTGNGSIAAIVDDGLDMYSVDLMNNYFAGGSYDFNDQAHEPRPRLSDDRHGTRCAGEVAAVKNNVCGVGVAYDSKVSGLRILSAPITEEDEAASINYAYQHNQIYSCSWGPVDDGETMDAPGLLIRRAIVNGVQKGRQGKGSVFVFAAGNGAANEDNCNFDGYTNSIYSITVGAIDREDKHPYYSESCSAQLTVTYSSGSGDAIHTTDVGLNSCSDRHGGTSAAGPLMAGVLSLALSVNPELTWRDVQYLTIETAVPFNLDEGGWQTTAIGKKFSHMFGYGKIDAYSLVKRAKDWVSVKPQAWFISPWLRVHHKVPQGTVGLASTFEVTEHMLKDENLDRVEHVTATMNVNHTRRGDLSVELHSPAGVVSHLSTPRPKDNEQSGYIDWTFMSVAHWGESGVGKWTIIVKDTNVNDHTGTFIDWQLTLWGEAIDPLHQRLYPLPTENDHEHDQSETAPLVTTTSVEPHPTGSGPVEVPTDHIDRPTKPKPLVTTTTKAVDEATATASSTLSESETFASASSMPENDKGVPSFFPTFGVSRRTQIWIYIALVLIVAFCSGLGAYVWIQRRKRTRNNPRDDYEFEMLDNDEHESYPLAGAGAGRKKKRTGGELYDAFAGESDEELLSDDDILNDVPHAQGAYHDSEPAARRGDGGPGHQDGEKGDRGDRGITGGHEQT